MVDKRYGNFLSTTLFFLYNYRLFIIGVSPLTNDVWAGDAIPMLDGRWKLVWEQMDRDTLVPFSPRAGLGEIYVG